MIGTQRELLRALLENTAACVTVWRGAPVPPPPDAPLGPKATPPSRPTANTATLQAKALMFLNERVIAVGADEIRRTYNSGTGLNEETVVGVREVSLTVTCETYGSVEASDILEKLRTRMRRSSVLAGLNAAGLSLIDCKQILSTPVTRDTRMISQAILEIRLNDAVTDADTTNDGNWIATADADWQT